MFGITKITEKHTTRANGFFVRLGYSNRKPLITKSFKLSQFNNSTSGCLKAAKAFRDNELLRLKEDGLYPPDKRKVKPLTNSKSGVCGVSRTHQRSGGEAIPNLYIWQASWINDDRTKGYASFAEKKYGGDNAFKLACASRNEKKRVSSFINETTSKEYHQSEEE